MLSGGSHLAATVEGLDAVAVVSQARRAVFSALLVLLGLEADRGPVGIQRGAQLGAALVALRKRGQGTRVRVACGVESARLEGGVPLVL